MTERVPDLLVDIQTIQGGFFGNRGIRRYSLGFARALLDRGVVRALLLNPSRPWLEEFPSDIRAAPQLTWTTRRKLRELTGGGAAAYVMTSPFEQASPVESALPSLVVESGTPIIVVLYDLIPEIVDVYPPSLMGGYRARRRLLEDADLVLTLSEHVRRDAGRRLGIPLERTAVIGAAASEFFGPRDPGERPRELLAANVPHLARSFVLSVTGWQAHKNVGGLIDAWSRVPRAVRRQYQLVLTCPLPPGAETAWNEVAERFGLAPDDVVVTGRVDDLVVRALYQEAELFVLPSFEEGFGLPVLEAARCGCPAITSSTSSLPEVLDWEPSTVRPDDLDQMAESLERGLLDPIFRADLRAVGDAAVSRHTWERVAGKTVEACARLPVGERRRRNPSPRIALVGRLTPSTTPTAIAADRVASLLPPTCAVERFDSAEPSRRGSVFSKSSGQRVGTYPVRALGRVRDPWGYDAIVYLVDAHPSGDLVALAKAHPGVVWFVDRPWDQHAATELTRGSTAVVRPAELSALAFDAHPFGRASPSVVAPEDGALEGDAAETDALMAALGMETSPVTRPAR